LQTTLLDTAIAPVSVVVAVQVNQDVRSYVPFIARVGSVIEALLVGVAARRPDKTMKSLMSLDSLRAKLAGCGRRRPRAGQSPSAAD